MTDSLHKDEDYFRHLKKISLFGRVYKKNISSPILLWCTRQFGERVMEVGCGIGSGLLGAYPSKVNGLDINVDAVQYCRKLGLNAQLVNEEGIFPVANETFDSCVLDNVLEHIVDPRITLDECYRITKKKGGLIIAVPGEKGFQTDLDHKINYKEKDLMKLDDRWRLLSLFSMPFIFKSEMVSNKMRQYCLVAVYQRVD